MFFQKEHTYIPKTAIPETNNGPVISKPAEIIKPKIVQNETIASQKYDNFINKNIIYVILVTKFCQYCDNFLLTIISLAFDYCHRKPLTKMTCKELTI